MIRGLIIAILTLVVIYIAAIILIALLPYVVGFLAIVFAVGLIKKGYDQAQLAGPAPPDTE
jgi:hypothetical protein